MAQILVPISDSAASGLTDAGAGSTNLYQSVDDGSTPNDADYYENTSPTTGAVDHKLSTGSDPSVNTGHILHLRGMSTAAGGYINVTLFQGDPGAGGTPIISAFDFSASSSPALTGSPGDITYTLTGGEADSITDYSDLYVALDIAGAGKGGAGSARLHNVYLEVPDAPVPMTVFRHHYQNQGIL